MVHYPLYDGLDPLGVDRFGKLMDAFSPIAIFASKPSRQQRPNRLKPVAIQLNSSSGMIFIFYFTLALLHTTPLRSTALYCTALYCTVLHCTALHCAALYLYCTALRCAALHCTVLYYTLMQCNVMSIFI